jgi:uncharacterized protein (DUF2062 family)
MRLESLAARLGRLTERTRRGLGRLTERVGDGAGRLTERTRDGLERAVVADHTPDQIAASFAFGAFVVALPTAGTALALFALAGYLVERVSKLALVATLVVFNPPVKWAVYGVSYWVGVQLLGPVPGVSASPAVVRNVSLSAGSAVLARQLLGNLLVATVLAVVGFALVRVAVVGYRRRHESVETAVDDLTAD